MGGGKSLGKEALKGNVPAIKEFGDRLDGKAPQAIGNMGADGEFKPQKNLVILYGTDASDSSTSEAEVPS